MADIRFKRPSSGGGGGGGSDFAPGEATLFTPNVVPFINGSGDADEDTNFTYQSGALGIGGAPTSIERLLVKGSNDSSGEIFRIQSATYQILKAYNNRSVVFGNGSAATNTDYTFNAFSASSTSNYTFAFVGNGSDNILRMVNSLNSTDAGVEIIRSALSSGRTALTIKGGSSNVLKVYSNGAIVFPTASAYNDSTEAYIMHSNTSGLEGLFFNIDTQNEDGFIFHKGRTTTGYGNNKPFMLLYSSWQDGGSAISGTNILNGWKPTYNYTGAGITDVVALDYNPTLTAMNGVHYALKIRSGRNAFNLGSSNSTAIMHIKGTGAASGAPIKVDSATLLSSIEAGALEQYNNHLYFSTSGVRKQLDDDFVSTPIDDHSAVGPTTSDINSGATITAMQICVFGSGGKWLLADATDVSASVGELAIALESKNDTQAMRVALPGSLVRDDSWSWTVGATLYLDTTSGAITETAPSATDEVVRIVGRARSATVIFFNPSTDYATIV